MKNQDNGVISGDFTKVAEGIWPDVVIIVDQRHGIRREFNRADGCPNPLEASRKIMKEQLFFPRHAVLWGCSLTVFCNRGEHESGRDWKTGARQRREG